MKTKVIKAAYVYPGWHSEPYRRNSDGKILNEWDLVINAKPFFKGHRQPRRPLFIYDDSEIKTSELQIDLALRYGIDAFIYCFYWSFGRRVLYRPLDESFLKCNKNTEIKFAIMWANRMPRGILPIKNTKGPIIHKSRFVYTDKEDFLNMIKFCAANYFLRPNYLKIDNRYLFLIFDPTFFLRDAGLKSAKEIIKSSREYLISRGMNDLYLIALNPALSFMSQYKMAGFDAISHYVFLPDWKGEYLQDYNIIIKKRASEWKSFQDLSSLPYYPSVSPGWDATPRGLFKNQKIPKRYPYHPVVINESPTKFKQFLIDSTKYTMKENREKLIFITSMNEYSEGHYIEPDMDFGYGFLEAIRDAQL